MMWLFGVSKQQRAMYLDSWGTIPKQGVGLSLGVLRM